MGWETCVACWLHACTWESIGTWWVCTYVLLHVSSFLCSQLVLPWWHSICGYCNHMLMRCHLYQVHVHPWHPPPGSQHNMSPQITTNLTPGFFHHWCNDVKVITSFPILMTTYKDLEPVNQLWSRVSQCREQNRLWRRDLSRWSPSFGQRRQIVFRQAMYRCWGGSHEHPSPRSSITTFSLPLVPFSLVHFPHPLSAFHITTDPLREEEIFYPNIMYRHLVSKDVVLLRLYSGRYVFEVPMTAFSLIIWL